MKEVHLIIGLWLGSPLSGFLPLMGCCTRYLYTEVRTTQGGDPTGHFHTELGELRNYISCIWNLLENRGGM